MDVENLKKEKAKAKAAFTRTLHCLEDVLVDVNELSSRRLIKEKRENSV